MPMLSPKVGVVDGLGRLFCRTCEERAYGIIKRVFRDTIGSVGPNVCDGCGKPLVTDETPTSVYVPVGHDVP